MDLSTLLDDIFIVAGVFFALAFLFAGLAFVINGLLRFAARFPVVQRLDVARAQPLVRGSLLTLFLLSATALVIFSVTMILQGRDPRTVSVELLTTALPPGFWQRLGIGLALTIALAVLAHYGLKLFDRLLPRLRGLISKNESIRISDERLDFFLRLLGQTVHIGAWLLVVIAGARLVGLPQGVVENLAVALRIFLIVQAGRMLVGLLGAIINTLPQTNTPCCGRWHTCVRGRRRARAPSAARCGPRSPRPSAWPGCAPCAPTSARGACCASPSAASPWAAQGIAARSG